METSFLTLSAQQQDQLAELERQALAFNEHLNLFSRASTDEFRLRHITHSLALARRPFPEGSVVADWGTGGGMPGLVLAVVFPSTPFHLIDSVGKKIRAVRSMARRLGLDNVEAHHARAETWQGVITHSVSRATAPLDTLWAWHQRVARPADATEGAWAPGLLCLKGGDLDEEIAALHQKDPRLHVTTTPVRHWLDDPAFEHKVIVQVTRS